MNPLRSIVFPLSLCYLLFASCTDATKTTLPTKTSEADLTRRITQEVDSLYAVYQRFDYDWIEFYADEYTAIYPDSPVRQSSKDSLRAQWKDLYKKYEVQLLDRGRPTVIPSEDMAMSYNTFHEIFINKATRDTINNVGTYIITWKRQPDDSWKIVVETLQHHD